MDLTPTERSLELAERLLAFMRDFVYPAEETYVGQRRTGDPHRLPPVVADLQRQARARGLWVRRSGQRAPFGRPLAEHGTISTWIAESRLEIDQARLLVLRAAWLMDTVGNHAARTEIAGIKVVAARTAARVIDRAIQVFGAAGLSGDTPLAMFYAIARQLRIVDGPDEVHLRSIARHEVRKASQGQASPAATWAASPGYTRTAPANSEPKLAGTTSTCSPG